MKSIKILLLVLFVGFSGFTTIESNVYICGPKGANKYHLNQNCRGLNSCTHEVYSVSLTQAKNYGLGLCGWED